MFDCKILSNIIKNDVKEKIAKLNIKPCLVVIQIGNNASSNIYLKSKKKACDEVGIIFKSISFVNNESEEYIINEIKKLNDDVNVTAILVQIPIIGNYNIGKIINTISKDKDVDGLTDYNISKLYKNEHDIIPCTPYGIIELFKYYNVDLMGKNVVIIGKSQLVGRPLMLLLLNLVATVTVFHFKTKKLKSITKKADILVVAVGHKHLIKKDMVMKNSIVIDVGINNVDGKIYGDVDFEKVSKKALATPVPGGIGVLTVSMLLKNVLICYEKKNNKCNNI